MHRIVVRVLLVVLCLLPLSAWAEQNQESAVAAALRMSYPNIPLREVNETPVEGIYEIVTTKDEILYFAPRSGHIFVGELWNSSGQNLTRASYNRLMSEKLADFPLDKALKIGDGPNQVVEISDPDCPFCREGSAFFAGRDDVTRYVFLFPLSKLHPQAEQKARYILSAADPAAAYEEVFSGAYDDKPLPEFKDNGRLDEQREIAARAGIHSTPRYWINGHFVAGNNPQEFTKLLDRK